ncbi:MAG: hypothetical protein RJA22_66 [Verrucomicrobiota bacterium]
MKRSVFLFSPLLVAAVLWVPPLAAQNPVAEAERQQQEERYQTLNRRMELLEESIAAHQKSVQALTDEVRKLKDEVDRARTRNDGAASQESLKRLQEAIVEVDKKRLADGERVTRSFEELRKLILRAAGGAGSTGAGGAAGTSGAESRTNRNPRTTGTGGTEPIIPGKGYKYAIKSGDTLSALVKALRADGHKVTERMIMDVNPGVNWNRLRVGQDVFIPETR